MPTTGDKRRQTKRRAKGSGSLTQKSNGIYCFQYRGKNGKKLTRSLGTRNRREAEKAIKPMVEALRSEDTVEALHQIAKAKELIDTRSLPLDEIWEAFKKTRPSASEGTMELYRRSLNRFISWAEVNRPGISEIADIDDQAAHDWLESEWKSGISASTYNDRRGAVLTITKSLMRAYKLRENPWMPTPRKKQAGNQQVRRPLTKDHVSKLLELDVDQDIYVLLLLGLCAGMRLKDAALLERKSISNNFVTYTPAKTRHTSSARVQVPIIPLLAKAIDRLEIESSQKYLLPRMAEWYMRNRNYLNKNILPVIHSVTGDARQDASGKGKIARREYGYHSLRHTFCTECARAGVTVSN